VPGDRARTMRTAMWLAIGAFLLYAATGGGRVVGSDELAMLELSRSLMRGTVTVPEGATMTRPDGTHVTKNAAAEAVLALPFVAAGEAAAAAAKLDPARRALAVRFFASFFNAFVTALMLAVFYRAARALGVRAGAALGAALMLGFTTPVWVYAKSFMAEPLQALGLLLALAGASLAGDPRAHERPGGAVGPAWAAAAGAALAISAKLSMLPLALACLAPLLAAPARRWIVPAAGVVLALAGHAAYNLARFGTPLETGYGAQASASAFTTPILVGLYGLVLSSGKGVMWFAPGLWLAPSGVRAVLGGVRGGWPGWWDRASRRAALGALLATAVALVLYGTFQHWAGDGSFGPRYLVPVLPLLFLCVGFALSAAGRVRRALAVGLAVVGLAVQVGGVAIYFGAQMREAGDYPYTLALEHPRFMSDSHFNPSFSPIVGHWRMLARNLDRHLRGEAPRISTGDAPDPRLGVGPEAQQTLLSALDFWWLYLGYAGYPTVPLVLAFLLIAGGAGFAFARARGAARAEAEVP